MSTNMFDGVTKESDWPPQIDDNYKRVRPLGEGAFGTVWLAKSKAKKRRETAATEEDGVNDDDDDSVDSCEKEDTFDASPAVQDDVSKSDGGGNNGDDSPPQYVAIKQITAVDESEKQYAAREIAILSEINHPNVVRCLRYAEMPRSCIVVLTLADGPNLNDLVVKGGALSVSLVRLAARHLISAVAYLHGRGKMKCMLIVIARNILANKQLLIVYCRRCYS